MNPISFVPTLPRLFPAAEEVLRIPTISHRSPEFETLFRRTELHLRKLCGGESFLPLLASGPGTFANELMLWNFSYGHKTLVLCNGEFGKRLAGACPGGTVLDFGFGKRWNEAQIVKALNEDPSIDRILGVRCETSSGMSNDECMLNRICESRGLWFALDAVSALGVEPELCSYPRLAMASGSSGKALAGLPGIAILLLNPQFPRDAYPAELPRIFSLETLLSARETPGMVRNTMSSLLLAVLEASCRSILELGQEKYRENLTALKHAVIARLAASGVEPLSESDSPIVTAFHRPPHPRWQTWLTALSENRVELYHRVSYLEHHGLFEIASMGDWRTEDCRRLCELPQ